MQHILLTAEKLCSKIHLCYFMSSWYIFIWYDEVLSGYQPGQVVERQANQRFEGHLCPRDVGLLTAQPFDPADSPRELRHTQSPESNKSHIFIWLLLFRNLKVLPPCS
jgi:hypothetical protein